MRLKKTNKLLYCSALCSSLLAFNAEAKEIDMNTAEMQAMDKITGRVSNLEAPVNSEVFFGSFSIVVRSCKTRSPEETPENFAFVDVVDNYKTENPVNIFRGWMMSSSPALNAVAHPIYDVWLLKCVNTDVSKAKKLSADALKDRNEIPKREDIEEKSEIPAADVAKEESKVQPVETEEKYLETKTAVENPAVALESDVAKEDKGAEPVVLEKDEPEIQASGQEEDGAPKSLLKIGGSSVESPVPSVSEQIKPAIKEEVSGDFLVIKEDNAPKPEPKVIENTSSAGDVTPQELAAPVENMANDDGLTPEEAQMLPELLSNAKPISAEELLPEPIEENGMDEEIPLISGNEIEENGIVEDQLINIEEKTDDLDLKADSLSLPNE